MKRILLILLLMLGTLASYSQLLPGVFASAAAPSSGGSSLLTGLVSYWKLDESSGNAADSYGSNTGTSSNITYYATGKINRCFSFNGSTSNVKVGDQTNLRLTTTGSISAWIYAGARTNNVIVSKSDWSTDRNGYSFVLLSGYALIELCDASSSVSVRSAAQIPLGTWTHIVATWNASNCYIYVNGSLSNSGSNGKTMTSTGQDFYIGYNSHYTSGTFNGYIDEVGVWNRLLTSAEVTSLYKGGAGLQYPFSL